MIHPHDLESITGLQAQGFGGFPNVEELRRRGFGEIPAVPGVYLFIRNSASNPDFLAAGTSPPFNKTRKLNYGIAELKQKWVKGALILYVGKAGQSGSDRTLRERVREMIRFGEGRPVAHRGGRSVWQLQDAERLQVCWKETRQEAPRDVEKALIQAFKLLHAGKLPFANRRV